MDAKVRERKKHNTTKGVWHRPEKVKDSYANNFVGIDFSKLRNTKGTDEAVSGQA